ncbi:MAG: hypothetical protein WAW07_06720 [Bacteroidales bacterium]
MSRIKTRNILEAVIVEDEPESLSLLSLNQVEYRIKVSQERLRSLIEKVREM